MTSTPGTKTKPPSVASISSMFAAAASGDIEKVRELVATYPDLVNASDKSGLTPLHFAANTGDAELAKFLTDEKANVNAKNKNGDTPLHMAVFAKHMAVASILRENGGVG